MGAEASVGILNSQFSSEKLERIVDPSQKMSLIGAQLFLTGSDVISVCSTLPKRMSSQPYSVAIPSAILFNVSTGESCIECCKIEDLVCYVVGDNPGFRGRGVKGTSVLCEPLNSCLALVVIILL